MTAEVAKGDAAALIRYTAERLGARLGGLTEDDFARAWFTSAPHVARNAVRSPDEARAFVVRSWRALADRVEAYDDKVLFAPMGAVGDPYAEASLYGLFLHAADEFIHHSAEVALLRDLYAHRQ